MQPSTMARLRCNQITGSIRSTRLVPRTTLPSPRVYQHRRYAGSSYGGGEGDPKGENPQDQGSNPSASLEHPGPPPPDVGQGTGGGPTQKGSEGHNTQQSPSSGGRGSSAGSSGGNGSPQPKIHQHNAPPEEHHSEDVRAHNEDMKRRHDRPEVKSPDDEDKVDKGFWKGEFDSINSNAHQLSTHQVVAVLIGILEAL